MLSSAAINLKLYLVFVPILFAIGLYYIIVTRNLFRMLIGLELMSKSVMLLLIVIGSLTGRTGLAQSFVVTMIVIEVVVIVVAAGLILSVYKQTDSIDARKLRNLKG